MLTGIYNQKWNNKKFSRMNFKNILNIFDYNHLKSIQALVFINFLVNDRLDKSLLLLHSHFQKLHLHELDFEHNDLNIDFQYI